MGVGFKCTLHLCAHLPAAQGGVLSATLALPSPCRSGDFSSAVRAGRPEVCSWRFISVSAALSPCSPLLHAPSVSFPWASVPSRPQCPPVLGGPRSSPTHVTPTPALLCHLPVPALGTVRSPQSACIWFPFDVKLNSSWLDSTPIRSGCVFAQPC